ncbi:MAG: hypothetical protein ACXADY_04055 [Candidatus Hodarchaeales archaeon]
MTKKFPCKYCNQKVVWSKDYNQGKSLVNLDGSSRLCQGSTVPHTNTPRQASTRLFCSLQSIDCKCTLCGWWIFEQRHCAMTSIAEKLNDR